MMSGLVALVGDAPHAWTMVNALRKRFGDYPEFEIVSVRGLGYKAVKKV